MSCNVIQHSNYHNLLICAPAQSFLKAFRSIPEASVLKRQRVHLILYDHTIIIMLFFHLSHHCMFLEESIYLHVDVFTCRDSLIFSNSSSRDFVCCSWAIFRSVTTNNTSLSLLQAAEESVRTGEVVSVYLLFTVLACSSCRVARVSLWAVSISIREASWFSVISSIWGKELKSDRSR